MPYDLFISYAHQDNSRGQVRELRDAILEDFQKFSGRNLSIFFDEHDIPSMTDWDKRIAQGLRESRLFLAIISPNYFASTFCRREWDEYVRYEAMRQCLGEGVAPVYFIELPGLDGPGIEQNIAAAVAEMRKRQWCDLASQKPVKIVPWHDAGKRALEDAEVARRLNVLKQQMAERLSRADRALQSPTNIYRHNPQFVGRVRELTLLREALNERGSVGVVGHKTQSAGATAVHGLGGMGKTELALAYAHAFAWDYPGGRWLARCEGLDNFDLVLRQLAEPLHVEFTEDEKKDAHRAGERILAELRRRDRSLLLLDNVTHSELLGPEVLMRLPPQGRIHLLATTRLGPAQLAGSPHDHTFVAVDELPAGDALALIRAHQPDSCFASANDETAARELVKLLDGFTLAVETSAIYLGRHAGPGAIADYTKRLRRELLGESESSAADAAVAVRHKEKLLERTLAITFESLNAEEFHVLAIASLLPADQIALPWLQDVASEQFPTLDSGGGVETNGMWRQLVDLLLSMRLFQTGGDVRVVRIHRLVRELIRKRLPCPKRELDHRIVGLVSKRSRTLAERWTDPDTRWEITPLDAFLQDFPVAELRAAGDIAYSLGTVQLELGDIGSAEKSISAALRIDQRTRPPDDPSIGATFNTLGRILWARGKTEEAETYMRKAIDLARRGDAQAKDGLPFRLNNLAQMLKESGKRVEAEPLFREALALHEQAQGTEGRQVAECLHNLHALTLAEGRHEEAEAFLRRALAIEEKILPANHPNRAIRLLARAGLAKSKGHTAEASSLALNALEIAEQCFGSESPRLLTFLFGSIGMAGDTPASRKLRIQALGISPYGSQIRFEETLGVWLGILQSLLKSPTNSTEPESFIRMALNATRCPDAESKPVFLHCRACLAILLVDLGKPRDGIAVLDQTAHEANSAGHPLTLDYADGLATVAHRLRALDLDAEAVEIFCQVLAIQESHWGATEPKLSSVLNNLGASLNDVYRYAEAEPVYARALPLAAAFVGKESLDYATLAQNYMTVLFRLERFEEAEAMAIETLVVTEAHRARTGQAHPYGEAALQTFQRIQTALGRDLNAAMARLAARLQK